MIAISARLFSLFSSYHFAPKQIDEMKTNIQINKCQLMGQLGVQFALYSMILYLFGVYFVKMVAL